jgi:chromosome segregation ATPase
MAKDTPTLDKAQEAVKDLEAQIGELQRRLLELGEQLPELRHSLQLARASYDQDREKIGILAISDCREEIREYQTELTRLQKLLLFAKEELRFAEQAESDLRMQEAAPEAKRLARDLLKALKAAEAAHSAYHKYRVGFGLIETAQWPGTHWALEERSLADWKRQLDLFGRG